MALPKPRISVIPASEPGSRVAESKQFTGSRVKPGMTMLLIYSDFTLKRQCHSERGDLNPRSQLDPVEYLGNRPTAVAKV